MIRQRPNAAQEKDQGKNKDKEKVEPIDLDEQIRQTEILAKELTSQQETIHKAFQVFCFCLAAATLLCAWWLELRQQAEDHEDLQHSPHKGHTPSYVSMVRWGHAVCSAGLHVLASHVAMHQPDGRQMIYYLYLPAFVVVFVGAGALMAVRHAKEELKNIENVVILRGLSVLTLALVYHQGIVFANLLSAVAAVWIRYDSLTLHEQLHDLKESQYRYKSL